MAGITTVLPNVDTIATTSDLELLSPADLKEFPLALHHRLDELPRVHPVSRRHRPHPDYAVKERILKMLDDPNDGPELARYDAERERLRTVIDPD